MTILHRKKDSRILIVDDERDVANSFADLLQALGYQTRCVYDGHEALAAADEFLPAMVFVDIGLPDMDGYELGRRLRAALPKLCLVGLSGEASEERQNFAAKFFDAFILKPGSLQHIEEALALAP